MAKDKKIRLHLSSYAIDPERIERRANEMAKEGWLLEKFVSLVSAYRRGEPNEYEYRVQVKEAGIDRLTYIAELTEFGIEEVGGVGDLLVLRKKADGTPRFPHRPAEKSRALPARRSAAEPWLDEHHADEYSNDADECERDRQVCGYGRHKLPLVAGISPCGVGTAPAHLRRGDCRLPAGTAPRETEDHVA